MLNSGLWDSVGGDDAKDEVAALWAEQAELANRLERERYLVEIDPFPFDSPYSELFADLVAVAEINTPKYFSKKCAPMELTKLK